MQAPPRSLTTVVPQMRHSWALDVHVASSRQSDAGKRFLPALFRSASMASDGSSGACEPCAVDCSSRFAGRVGTLILLPRSRGRSPAYCWCSGRPSISRLSLLPRFSPRTLITTLSMSLLDLLGSVGIDLTTGRSRMEGRTMEKVSTTATPKRQSVERYGIFQRGLGDAHADLSTIYLKLNKRPIERQVRSLISARRE